MASIADLHRVAWCARDPSWTSHLNCGPINTNLRDALNEAFGEVADVAIGKVLERPGRPLGWGAEHAFVYVPAEHVTEGTDVILDGALDQFCLSLYEDGYVDVWLFPREEFPKRVSIVTAADAYNPSGFEDLFEHFVIEERNGPVAESIVV